MKSIWDCCDPCILLALTLKELNRAPNNQELNTLDSFGYLNEDKSIDMEAMEKTYKKYVEIKDAEFEILDTKSNTDTFVLDDDDDTLPITDDELYSIMIDIGGEG